MSRTKAISSSVLHQALRYRGLDGAFTKTMDTLTGGPFLAGLALALGASTLQIGFIAAIPFLAKIMYIPAVSVVERVGNRKKICVVANLLSRPLWLVVAFGALMIPHADALDLLIGMLLIISILATFSGLSWNIWMKDLLPRRIRGRMFSRRLLAMGTVGMALSLLGAAMVDFLTQSGQPQIQTLSYLMIVGAVGGIIGIFFLSRIPEPNPLKRQPIPLKRALLQPFKDKAFRRLIGFSGSWAFATNLAVPFITVYMLQTLGLPFSTVIGFTVASQLANLALLNLWGRMADRFGNKPVLFVCAPVFSLSLLLWTFTVNDQLWISLSLIAVIHIMNGMATAGIDVSNNNLLYQLAPALHATPYLAVAALINSLAAGVAPIVGGVLGSLFANHALSIPLVWERLDQGTSISLTPIRLAHLDFVFLAAFLVGLFSLNRLTLVRERAQELLRSHMVKSVKQEIQNVATIRGLRYLTQTASFFAGLLLESGALVSPKQPDRSPSQDAPDP